MRAAFCDVLTARAEDPRMVFLTGDLGFMALEPLRDALGDRFINAGVAEQNMVGVAAALAAQGLRPWIYSIAPFCYARPFEQIRNDVTFHRLPVRLVGNGGGFGYGVQGPTHHAIEDYGVLLTLDHLDVFVPAFDEDVAAVVERMLASDRASYLRLGRGEAPGGWAIPAYAPWRRLLEGGGPAVVAVGPIAGSLIAPLHALAQETRPQLWALAELPLDPNALPAELLERATSHGIAVVEEHVRQGSAASLLALAFAERGVHARRFQSFNAAAHRFDRYGSQRYLRAQCGLDAASILRSVGA